MDSNPEANDYQAQLKQNKQSIYINPKEPSLPKRKGDKYGPANQYKNQPFKNTQGDSCVLNDTEDATLKKMVAMSIKHHDPYMCVCAFCTCGRHLCKVHAVRAPGVKPFSTYDRDFTKKKPFEDVKFRPGTSYKDQGPGIDPLSTYTK